MNQHQSDGFYRPVIVDYFSEKQNDVGKIRYISAGGYHSLALTESKKNKELY